MAQQITDDHHYVVISADNHAGSDLLGYKPFLEKKWHDEFDVWAAAYTNPWDFVDPRMKRDDFRVDKNQLLAGAASWHSPLNWESETRLEHMDIDGVAGEVIFPNTAPPFMSGSVLTGKGPASRAEYERRWAGLQAHNRWLADFCDKAPERRAGIAQVLLDDVDDAVSEVRAIKAMGLRGGILLPMDGPLGGTRPMQDVSLEPLWAVCEELDVPIHKHSSAPPEQANGTPGSLGEIAIGFAERQFFNHRCVAQLIFAGVLERHPGLKVVLSESGSSWVPDHLRRLDSLYHAGSNENGLLAFLTPSMRTLSMPPSEYFKRNFFLGSSLFLPSEAEKRYEIGVDKIMWAVDYPHSEGTFPYSRDAIAHTFPGVPKDEIAAMLGLNAIEVFGFDLEAMQKIADKIGPTVDEINQIPTSLPDVPEESLSPVFAENAIGER
ncbi:putative TIM-barrel fold metal-dependent hydrolase [Rhodococcus sp. 27YEA15]|uniref:amidohydrolase family protein n=1 Tax=Rhodococcus sp. 27YEA15 TaxID=3156259 RepID=UPI003C7BE87C